MRGLQVGGRTVMSHCLPNLEEWKPGSLSSLVSCVRLNGNLQT